LFQDNIEIQKKTCTRWINWRLANGDQSVTDICYDLRSGVVLLQLLSRLTGSVSRPVLLESSRKFILKPAEY
jgi:hypothetical protein